MARADLMVRREFRPGWNDFAGWLYVLGAAVVALALFTYDRHDLATNSLPPNSSVHNFMGVFGARLASGLFFLVGATAYVLPVVGAALGLARFLESLRYLRHWRAALGVSGLVIAVAGALDLAPPDWLPSLGVRGESLGPGGVLGWALNHYLFRHFFNTTGAGLLYALVYLGSLLLLTDFHLLRWIGSWLQAVFEKVPADPDASPGEKALARQTRDLEKQRRQLEKKLAGETAPTPAAPGRKAPATPPGEVPAPGEESPPRKGLGADLQPIPEPTVRDLSVPQPARGTQQVVATGDVIRAEEISAGPGPALAPGPAERRPRSITDRILGREAAAPAPLPTAPAEGPGPASAEAPARLPADLPIDGEPSGLSDPDPEAAAGGEAGETGPALAPTAPPARGRMQPRKPKPLAVATTPVIGDYQLPSLDLLNLPDLTVKPTETKEELMANARLMVQTLAQFGIEAAAGDITKGPTITRYELHPAPGVKLEKIAALTNNIAAALKAERLNILAPVPGKSSVGVEVPNAVKTKVIMRDLLEAPEWAASKARIPLALGKDVYGHPIIADLAEMPHVLIAGSTGSGKSVCINTIIASLLFRFTPDQLRFVMIDPKVVELQQYNALPHLVVPVVTDPKKVILALRWVVNEMEKRYQIFARVGVRNIKAFNERPKDKPLPVREPELPLLQKKDKVEPGADGFAVEVDEQIVVPRDEDIVIPEKLSYIVVIIDELADLMLVAPADVEMAIARITQMARAAGIHCIVATQRPSVDVITGVIKANIPARIAFQVAAKVDSRTILDQMGADKLLGKGDMLYLPPGSAKLVRAQGALITDQEIERLVEHIARQGKPSYDQEIHQALQKAPSSLGTMSLDPDEEGSSEDDVLVQKCLEVIRSEKKASVSLLQRRLKLGYGRAARLMDELEDRGIVGPSKGAEPRDILLDLDGEGYDGGGQQMV